MFSLVPPNSKAHNVIMGRTWVDCYGTFTLVNASSGATCSLYFTPCGWFSYGRYEVSHHWWPASAWASGAEVRIQCWSRTSGAEQGGDLLLVFTPCSCSATGGIRWVDVGSQQSVLPEQDSLQESMRYPFTLRVQRTRGSDSELSATCLYITP